MRAADLVKRLKVYSGSVIKEPHRIEMAKTALDQAMRSTNENDIGYCRSGDSLAICVKQSAYDSCEYELLLCTIDMYSATYEDGE